MVFEAAVIVLTQAGHALPSVAATAGFASPKVSGPLPWGEGGAAGRDRVRGPVARRIDAEGHARQST